MYVASVDYGGMKGTVWLIEKACLIRHWICGYTEAAEEAMATEDAGVEMDFRCYRERGDRYMFRNNRSWLKYR